MDQVIQLTFDGVVIGMLYAVVGLGVVIVFRTTNVLNFTQGAVATVAGYIAWEVSSRIGFMPYASGMLAAIVIGGALGILIGLLTTFVLKDASPLTKSVATLGVFLILGWIAREVFGDLSRTLERPFDGTMEVAGVLIGGHGLFVIAISAVALIVTFWLLERTRLGLGMRALSQDSATARIHGVSLVFTSLAAWGIASALGAASGVLVGSFIQVDHTIMTTILIQSIAALVVGGFGTAGGAVVGGISLGVVSSLIAGLASPGFKNTFVFAIIILVLVVRPNGLLGKAAVIVPESGEAEETPSLPRPRTWRSPGRLALGAAGALFILAVPVLPHPFSLRTYSVALAVSVAVISLSFFMGYVGEISLGHGALVTVGAYTTGLLMANLGGVDYGVAIVASALAAGVVGALLGVVTLRLSGVYLAIATLALSFVVIEVVLQLREITGGAAGIVISTPSVLGFELSSDRSIYYLCALVLGVVILVTSALIRSPIGQRWVAVRDSGIAAATNGVAVRQYTVLAFAISSAIAGVAGSLLAGAVSFVAPFDYGLFFSIYVILAVIVGGAGSLVGAILGASFITLMPVALSRTSGLTDAVFGAALLLLLVILPGGFRGLISRFSERRGHAPAGRGVPGAESEEGSEHAVGF